MSFIINLQANITFNKSWKYNPWLFLVNQIIVIIRCSLKMNEDILMNRNILNICKILERMEVPLKYYIEKVKKILFQMLVIISNMVLFFFPKLALWEMGEGSPIISIFQMNQLRLREKFVWHRPFEMSDSPNGHYMLLVRHLADFLVVSHSSVPQKHLSSPL